MTAQTIQRLHELARSDPAVAPLVRLQARALEAAADRAWDAAVPAFSAERLAEGLPLLHDAVLTVDGDRATALLIALAGLVEQDDPGLAGSGKSLTDGALDPLALVAASIAQDDAHLDELGGASSVHPGLLGTLGGLLALPLLQACGRKAAPLVERARWGEGSCPVCAAWAALAELRGLEKRRWLRCARCGAGWEVAQDGCTFCGEADWRRLGYLAAEGDTESRRAVTCQSCRGYLKTLASLTPLGPADVAVADVLSLELDMAALEREFSRPQLPAFPLAVTVQPAKRRGFWTRR